MSNFIPHPPAPDWEEIIDIIETIADYFDD